MCAWWDIWALFCWSLTMSMLDCLMDAFLGLEGVTCCLELTILMSFNSCELLVVAVGLSSALVCMMALLVDTYSLSTILLGLCVLVLDSEMIRLPILTFCFSFCLTVLEICSPYLSMYFSNLLFLCGLFSEPSLLSLERSRFRSIFM